MTSRRTAIVVGVGPGLGWSLVKRFAAAGMAVAMVARR
jgi:NAD(P)-dependent dehydrogenase (short-subunit alcohol dehydrogenase family)